MSIPDRKSLSISILLLIASATFVQAGEVKVSGTITFVTVSEESTKLKDGRTVIHLHDKGIVVANIATSPFHLTSEDCFNTVMQEADGKFITAAGNCETIDKDGDAWWLSWAGTPDGSKWTVYHGTGKYEGMAGGGTTVTQIMLPDRSTLTYEGTVTMK